MKKLTRALIYLCLFGLTLGAFVYLGKKDYGTKISDAKKFSREYKISENNKFKYVKSYEVLDIIEHKSGVILMGFSNNEWMQYYVRYLNEAVNEDDIKTIYYYDLLEDRTRKNKNFVKIEDIMSSYLKQTDDGKEYLFTPALVFVKNGQIINYDDETSLVSYKTAPESYWTLDQVTNFKNKISIYLGEEDYDNW